MKEITEQIISSKNFNIPAKELGAKWADLYNILYELLERREYLQPLAREFEQIDKALKDYFVGTPTCAIGGYQVSGDLVEEENFCIPEHLKNKYLRRDKKWHVEIRKI